MDSFQIHFKLRLQAQQTQPDKALVTRTEITRERVRQENLPAYLAPRSTTAILPALLKACVPVRANDPVIQTSSIYVPHGIFCICS